ncbi:transcriptional regulator, TetR family [Lutimaribacter pacificus]|uniref:Transcriptional regulator, TetR family n=1 Tax=Lutimaribacter pacificus TaxID=391948 RepID=A0A1H0EP80_9RHOB|nr:TetR/AcrR family transcriptional regulator [Lutimaribacter pacificus]SDN84161.1 transcriptional regulator, TetR family [Lutimaribacter pacificus]SHK39400.1 transcriptional regulator, TetR family [Lutimaribacter pacificus]
MPVSELIETDRKRAPSKRALATRNRVFDAAEKLFAEKGFDGATIRDIAAEAGEPVGTIHHHGGGKEALFHKVVARRAGALSQSRLDALERLRAGGQVTLDTVLSAFVRPFFELSREEPRWRNYARLVAYVSADDRWRAISAEWFDPTAEVFLAEIVGLVPEAPRHEIAGGFVFCVASMLALLTARGRIAVLAGGDAAEEAQLDHLIRYCAAGMAAGQGR